MLAYLFVNHDQTKLHVDASIILNLSLVAVFSFLILMTCRKTNEDRPLSILQTNQTKGLAMIAIILHHLAYYTIENPRDLLFFYKLGFVGVAVFLVISGFGLSISMEKKGIENFFSKRVVRVYVPLVFAMLLELFLRRILLPEKSNIIQDLVKVLLNFPSLDRNMWFIAFIFFWYCLTYFVFRIGLSNKAKIIFLSSISMIIVAIPEFPPTWKANSLSFPLGCWLGLNHKFIIEKVNVLLKRNILILMGIIGSCILLASAPKMVILIFSICLVAAVGLIYLLKRKVKVKRPLESISFCLTITIICFNYLSWVFDYSIAGEQNIANSISHNIIAILMAASICLLVSLMVKFKSYSLFLNFMGEISFELYLLHGMFMYSFDFILFRGNVSVTFFVYFIAICLASIILKHLSSMTSDLILKKCQ